MEAEEELQMVFELAKGKFLQRMSKPGNTERPWNDFSIEHLCERLNDEVDEYYDGGKIKELLDIINMGAIIYLAELNRLSEGLEE